LRLFAPGKIRAAAVRERSGWQNRHRPLAHARGSDNQASFLRTKHAASRRDPVTAKIVVPAEVIENYGQDIARASIKQVGAEEARDLMKNSGAVVVDVRESDEWRQGHIPEAIFIPRGFLELRVEDKIPDHKAPVILQCASGTRSLLAARTLR
jgi:rhodanese-related sulfurtransferase